MIPEYSFLFDGTDDEAEYDATENIPYAPSLHTHIHPHDFFRVTINDNTRYIGEYICTRVKNRVPIWQQSSALPYGDSLAIALFRLFVTHNQATQINTVEGHLLRVPLEDFSKCLGLHQVYRSNAFVWVAMHQITDVAFISHAEVVQNSYLQFGGKGVQNSYVLYSGITYYMTSNAEIQLTCHTIHHSTFYPFANAHPSSLVHISPSFNSRLFSALGALRSETNRLIHTKRMFQRNGYTLNHQLPSECFAYICGRLRGACMIVDGEVSRVRRLFLSDLAQEKRKFHREKITTIKIETDEDLVSLRKIFGSAFGAGARCSPRLKDGVLRVKQNSTINAVCPPSEESLSKIKRYKKRKNRIDRIVCLHDCANTLTDDELLSSKSKLDMIQIKFDHSTSVAVITVIFTRLIVGDDAHVIKVLKSIQHNQLVEKIISVELELGTEFVRDGRRWMIEEIAGSIITASNSDDETITINKSCII